MNNYCRNHLNACSSPLNNLYIENTNVANTSNDTNVNNCTNQRLLDVLCNCIGHKCVCDFDTSRGIESKTGILERIGEDYLVLRSVNSNKLMYCNTCELRFVTICC